MGKKVYANNREVSCKAADGKSLASFPDVCLSPPTPPAGPLPIPYPNSANASDCSGGTTSVQIGGQEAMIKNKSYFKVSTGDEASTKTLGMGVVTHEIKGKAYFTVWSMDVHAENENVVRHLDLTTHNHMAQQPMNTVPWPYLDGMAMGVALKCAGDIAKEVDACAEYAPYGSKSVCAATSLTGSAETMRDKSVAAAAAQRAEANPCMAARRCRLAPYDAKDDGVEGCCPAQTPEHVVDAASFYKPGQRGVNGQQIAGWKKYNADKAPCVCAEGAGYTQGSHGEMHARKSAVGVHKRDSNGNWPREEATKTGAKAATMVFVQGGCSAECLEAQLNQYHDKVKEDPEQPVRAPSCRKKDGRAEYERDMGIPSAPPAPTP